MDEIHKCDRSNNVIEKYLFFLVVFSIFYNESFMYEFPKFPEW